MLQYHYMNEKAGWLVDHETDNSARWDMSEVAPLQTTSEEDGREVPEEDVASGKQEKETAIHEARKKIENVYESMQATEPATGAESQPISPYTVEAQSSIKPKVGQVLKRTATVAGSTVMIGAFSIAMIAAPVVVPLVLPAAVFAADSVIYNIRGVNGSMFEVNRKHQIKQRLNPFPVLMKHRGKSSSEIFREETEKLFDGLQPGEIYSTKSHAMTYALLRKAQNEGRITDLSREKSGKSRLLLENIVTGNWQAIRSGKKHDMYKISFKVV